MDLSRIILGGVLTEKAERLKGRKTYTLSVVPAATKVAIRQALKALYDVDATAIRVLSVRPKQRSTADGRCIEKRHRGKKAIVVLSEGSKALDLASFRER